MRPVERYLTFWVPLFVNLCFNWSEFIREELRRSWERLLLLSFIIIVQDEFFIASHQKMVMLLLLLTVYGRTRPEQQVFVTSSCGYTQAESTQKAHANKISDELMHTHILSVNCMCWEVYNSNGECMQWVSQFVGVFSTSLSSPYPMWLCYSRRQADKKCPATVLVKAQGTSRMLKEAKTLVYVQSVIESGLGFPFVPFLPLICFPFRVWSLHRIFWNLLFYSLHRVEVCLQCV